MNRGLLLISAFSALVIIGMNIWVMERLQDKHLQLLVTALLLFTSLRYVTLIIYTNKPTYDMLQKFRYFYFASSIGLTMTTLLALWHVIPVLRINLKPYWIPLLFLPWNLFYLYIIVKQPTQIIKAKQFGYELLLTGKFPFYLSVAQGSLALIIILIGIGGIIKYKHLQIRVQLIFILLAQLLLIADGLSYYLIARGLIEVRVFQPFTFTEAFGFAATYYAFSKQIKILNQKNSH